MSMIYRTRVCEVCEEWDCAADRMRQTMATGKMVVSYGQPGFAEAVECAFKAMKLKATYKARAEAAEGKADRVRELAGKWQADNSSYEGMHSYDAVDTAADELLEVLNGK